MSGVQNGKLPAYIVIAALAGGGGWFGNEIAKPQPDELSAVSVEQVQEAIALHARSAHKDSVSRAELVQVVRRLERIEKLLDALLLLEREKTLSEGDFDN